MGQCWLQGAASHRAGGGGGYYTVNANGSCREHKQTYWHAEFVCFRRVILGQRLNQDTLLTSVKGQFDISQQEHRRQPPNNAALFRDRTKVIGLGYQNKSPKRGVTKRRTLVTMTLWHTDVSFMWSSVCELPSHALWVLQSWVLKFFCRREKPETRQVVQSSFKSNYHGTGPFSNPLLAYWGECWGPCSPMHTVPASSSCSSATPGLSSSHTEWMEPPEECGHKRRNVIFAECYHPSTAQCTHATNGHLCQNTHTHTQKHPASRGMFICWG